MLGRALVLGWWCTACAGSSPLRSDAGVDAGVDVGVDAGRAAVRFRKLVLTHEFFAEGAAVGDFDRDGTLDVVSGPYWYAGPDFTARHELFAPVAFELTGYSNSFFAFVDDFDHDGWPDVLNVGFPGTQASWLRNPGGSGQPWTRTPVLDAVDVESPTLTRLGGSDAALVCGHAGQLGYARPEAADPFAPWTFVPLTPPGPFGAFTHGLGVGDLDGDGRLDLLEARGAWLSPEDGGLSTLRPADFGSGGAQMFALDVDGDGDADVVTSLAAHGFGHAWFEQLPDAGFLEHDFSGSDPDAGLAFFQPHALAHADLNGDGLEDLVVGERFWAHVPAGTPDPSGPALLAWFELERGAAGPHFIPHLIDDASGVGTQVMAADIDRDGRPDLVVANKKGAFVFLQEP